MDSDCSTGSWEPFKDNKLWKLTDLNRSVTVYVKYKYKYDESGCVHDKIVHDNIPPELEFVQRFKNVWIKNKDLDISFRAQDFGSGLKSIHCDLSGRGEFKLCSKVISLKSMKENRSYKLTVRVQDKAGNSVTKGLNWRSDQSPPRIVFNSKPPAVTNRSHSQFSFTASDFGSGVAGYWCRFDDQAQFKRCNNNMTLKNLKDGNHRLEVRAMDNVGRVSRIISHSWVQDRLAPDCSFHSKTLIYYKRDKGLVCFC